MKRKVCGLCCVVVSVQNTLNHTGDDSKRDPPVPIPNTEVKPLSAECTWLETARENRTLPVPKQKSERTQQTSDKLDGRSLFCLIKQKSKRKRAGAAQAASAFSFFACLRGHPAIRKRLSRESALLRVAAELCFAARSFS